MLACTRSLMYPGVLFVDEVVVAHMVSSSDASAILELASSAPSGARAANTEETECSASSRMWRISVGFVVGTPARTTTRTGLR